MFLKVIYYNIYGGNMKRGFTLIELLAVMLILGIIMLIAFPNIQKAFKKSSEKLL